MTSISFVPPELVFRSACDLVTALKKREISSRELLAAMLGQIERINPRVNAVVTLDIEHAQATALAVDNERIAGNEHGALFGLPMTIKDAIETANIRSTGGSMELIDNIPTSDAPAVANLKAAGAIVFGKTNLPEYSSDSQSYNDIFGTTSNPWDLTRTAGGSSGGAAAAVATGMTPLELGTDILGSIRIPASFCGVYGLKPSYGVIAQLGYLRNATGGTTSDIDINVFGPIARTPEDLLLSLDVLAATHAPQLLKTPKLDVRELRIGYWFTDSACPIDQEVHRVLENAVTALSDNGVRVEAAKPDINFDEAIDVLFSIVPVRRGGNALHERNARHDAVVVQQRLMSQWSTWFQQYDALLCPVTPTTAFPHDHQRDRSKRSTVVNQENYPYLNGVLWTGIIGVAHLPAVAMPIGRTASGLPVGVQVVTALHADRKAIEIARIMSEVVGGFEQPPVVTTARRSQCGRDLLPADSRD